MNELDIFSAALALQSPEERGRYLDDVCGQDRELRRRFEELLCAHAQAGSFMGVPISDRIPQVTLDELIREIPGTIIGPYKLLQQIGEGGMGVVWMAEQTQPVHRKVALKVIKPGMDSRQVIARFEAERQALAMMDHVNIARVIDGGATENGRPYFVMELVHGVPITKYCDDNHLTPRDRLELFVPVCQAIQHAHQKGIIHRDIKPSNVMVTLYDGKPVPKVIDFGVAKATEQKLTERTLFTQFGAMVGTLEYMSPEQAEMSALGVDTRSDIYSLGVLLYELLTGSTPLTHKRMKEAAYAEILRMIKEEEPPKPSTRLSDSGEALASISANRHTEPAKLTKLVRGELDWIVMKALEKDRNRRYETASALAQDVERYLHDEQVQACPPSATYRFKKFVRRNRTTVAIATLAALVVVVSVVFSLIAVYQQMQQRELQAAAENAETQRLQAQLAREVALPEVSRLAEARLPVAALRRLQTVESVLSGDPQVAALALQLAAPADVRTEPPGVQVWIQDWRAPADDWLAVGSTPLLAARLPREQIRWKFEKQGYASRQVVASAAELPEASVELQPLADVPDGMVYVPASAATPTSPALGRFFIDRYEVTNVEYQKFVDAGGYRKREYWKQILAGPGARAPTWEEAIKQFKDGTGMAGPATWTGGNFARGEERHPVRGVSWFEAAAYAEFVGKSLPTVYHWNRVAGLPRSANSSYLGLSNFSSRPAAVGTYRGIGPFDVYDLAGNVREWCWNPTSNGHRLVRGGAFGEPAYMFDTPDSADPLDRSPGTGLRCVRYLEPIADKLVGIVPIPVREFGREVPANRAEVEAYRRLFAYDNKAPLHIQPVAADDESNVLRHEIIRIDTAYGERFTVHLLLPRRSLTPYPTVLYFPGTGILQYHEFDKIRTHPDWELARRLVEHGWAVCWPTLLGSFERNLGSWPPPTSIAWRDRMVKVVKDLSRSVDFLETRKDIDHDRLAYVGFSWGAVNGPLALVVETRCRAGVLVSGGHRARAVAPEVEALNYCPHVNVPVLMISGRLDEAIRLEAFQAPFFQQLGSTDKKWILMNAGHVLPWGEAVQRIDEWLGERLRVGAGKRNPRAKPTADS